ncbi:uncharacterized protein LOC142519886 [Primulina tabacum]|uniref:uncharacterized protein LOC142519886 n=1 Tax=Primulina tabacum TaxID=48773 RepID=UPI003F5AC827
MLLRNLLSVIFDQNKQSKPNYHDWLRNLKILMKSEMIAYVLKKSHPKEAAPANAHAEELAKLDRWWQAKSYILASMSKEMQRLFENAENVVSIYMCLQEFYGPQTRPLRHAAIKELMTTSLRDEASVHDHGVRMIELIEKLAGLDIVLPNKFSTSIQFLSVQASFDGFVVNFNMNNIEEKHVFLVDSSSGKKKGQQEKGKKHFAHSKKNKPEKNQSPNATKGPSKLEKLEEVCFHYKKPRH